METPPLPPVSAAPNVAPAQSQPASQPNPPAGPRFPIVRLVPRRRKMRLIAIYEDHILAGACGRRFSLTESMLATEGEAELCAGMRKVQRIDFRDVTNIKMHLGKLQQFFQLHAPGKNIDFTLPKAQAGHICEFLRVKLADKVPVRSLRAGKGSSIFLLILGLAAGAGGVSLINMGERPLGMMTSIFGLGIMLLGSWLLFGHSSKWAAAGKSTAAAALAAKHAAPVAKLPLRSKPLGWTLKILGVLYWFFIVSPLTDSLQGLLNTVFSDNMQAQSSVWTLLWIPAPLLIFFGYRLCQTRYIPKQNEDPRKPILFLRPFQDDEHTSLQPSGWTAQATGIRSRPPFVPKGQTSLWDVLWSSHPVRMIRMLADYSAGSSEESIARYFERFGPVIAIGKPGERFASPGAARMYVDDASWQDAILYEMKRAQAVVMQPAPTDGVRWELNHIRDNVAPYRVLFCLVSYWNNPEVYEDLCRVVADTLRVQLPRSIPYLPRPAFVYFDEQWNPHVQQLSYKDPMLWPVTADGADMHYSLGGFVEGMEGAPRSPVRPTKWLGGAKSWFASAAAVLIGVAVVLAANGIIRVAAGWAGAAIGAISPHDQEVARFVDGSPRVTLQGTAVAYQIQVPQGMADSKSDNAMVEHFLKTSDSHFDLQVIVDKNPEDLSDLVQQRLAANQKDVLGAQIDAQRQVQEAGVNWTEAQIGVTAKQGLVVQETMRASSSPHGTVLLILHTIKSPNTDAIYQKLADEVLASFQFTGGAGN